MLLLGREYELVEVPVFPVLLLYAEDVPVGRELELVVLVLL